MDELKKITELLERVDRRLEAIQRGQSVTTLALSNFVGEQTDINEKHAKSMGDIMGCLDSWFKAEGKLRKISKN